MVMDFSLRARDSSAVRAKHRAGHSVDQISHQKWSLEVLTGVDPQIWMPNSNEVLGLNFLWTACELGASDGNSEH